MAIVETWLIIGVLFGAGIMWWRRIGLPWLTTKGLLNVYRFFKKQGSPEGECLFQMFNTRLRWKRLPESFLRELATRLQTKENIVRFVILNERSGTLQNYVQQHIAMIDDEPELALGSIAITLFSYGNAKGSEGKLEEAKNAFELSLLLKPSNPGVWSSLALVAFKVKDYHAAIHWADRVLNFSPNPDSEDIWERGLARSTVPGEMKKITEFLGEPGLADSWEQIRHQMKEIKDACNK